jgi:hypothetical protein
MIVRPGWKQHVYTDRQLNNILRRGVATEDQLCQLLLRAISQMTEEQKARIREELNRGLRGVK